MKKKKFCTGLYICGLIVLIITLLKFEFINPTNLVSGNYIYNFQYQQQKSILESLNPKNELVVFLGDSLTSRGNWKEFFPNIKIINRGIGGDTTTGVLKRIDNIISLKPKKIFLMIGVNDLTKNIRKTTTINNYDMIIKKLKTKIPSTQIYLQSVLPVNSKLIKIKNEEIISLNRQIMKFAYQYKLYYIDINSYLIENNQLPTKYTADGIHLKDKAYKIWVNRIKSYIS